MCSIETWGPKAQRGFHISTLRPYILHSYRDSQAEFLGVFRCTYTGRVENHMEHKMDMNLQVEVKFRARVMGGPASRKKRLHI